MWLGRGMNLDHRGSAKGPSGVKLMPSALPFTYCFLPLSCSFRKKVEGFHKGHVASTLTADSYVDRTIMLVNCCPPFRCVWPGGGGVILLLFDCNALHICLV